MIGVLLATTGDSSALTWLTGFSKTAGVTVDAAGGTTVTGSLGAADGPTNSGTITASGQTSNTAKAGGAVGLNSVGNGLTISLFTNSGAVTSASSDAQYKGGAVGGIIGNTSAAPTITGNLANTGTITGCGEGVGGIVGWWTTGGAAYTTLTFANTGAVNSTSSTGQYVGGIIRHLVGA